MTEAMPNRDRPRAPASRTPIADPAKPMRKSAVPAAGAVAPPRPKGRLVSVTKASVGTYALPGYFFRKSKMPVFPGFVPVAKADHETGVCGGLVGVSGE